MEYRALFRKYRPQRFSELVGQGHVTETLVAEVQSGTVAHAYLFAGPRGTGKTTTARIIAKALNCERRGEDGEPCNECASCVAVTEGTSLDVIELDAASHNKVEDVREIRANVATVAASGGSRRVYILDEAHMLSRAASNALLKTLEEPPEHAHFVLATTEPYKLPDTIRSRTQRFDFHPIGSEVLVAHLEDVSGREGYTTSSDALALIARHARGSARDALGLLEQVAALGSGTVDVAGVTRALGMADIEAFGRLALAAVADQDAPGALTLVSEIASVGADLRRFAADALEFFRGLFLAQYAPNLEEIVDETDEVIAQWRAHAWTLSAGDVLRCIDQLGDALTALRAGREERLVLELTLLRLTRPETATDVASLASRLERLEDRVRRLQTSGPAPEAAAEAGRPEPTRASGPAPPADPGAPFAAPAGAQEEAAVVPVKPVEPAAEEPAAVAPATGTDARTETAVPREEVPAEDTVPGTEARTEAMVLEEEAPIEEREPEAEVPVEVAAPAKQFDLADLDRVWPALNQAVRQEAGVRRHALFSEVRPAAVEGDLIVLEVPASMPFHLDRLGVDDTLNTIFVAAATRMLGVPVRVTYRSADADEEETAPGDTEEEPSRAPDKDDLESPGDGGVDPLAIAKEMLGATRVDE